MRNFFKEFNIADWFSFYRILAAPFLILFLALGMRYWFAFFLLISYTTDAVDGYLARKLKISSSRGSQLDSLGDQLTLIVGLSGLLLFETNFIRENLLLIGLAFIPYLIQMAIAFRKYGKTTAFHTYLAKGSAVLQAVFIVWTLFFGPIYWLFYLMILAGILETLEEICLIFMYDTWVSDVKGFFWALKDPRRK
ncbi:CDP-alcohol phosphatidyltransferase family protein [Robiginitalea aurantiaca]|uniref:CDP-alcohol phosphatidyltransferase family protein n=1 Tax=Robiginitalea aurantiaca TaxID=3056915 RepID=A0ABT7WH49_9FLAO|nr:CDP-alcohol phosphatidyltransferase family protein [Robiginitalea aurantiaca]MDM9632251.1 CDP-alcohol phosphatidyltransferase family protein [Robiginitalea aurantiaca]